MPRFLGSDGDNDLIAPKLPRSPSILVIRWHGYMMGMGFFAQADPAARTAFGLPALSASME